VQVRICGGTGSSLVSRNAWNPPFNLLTCGSITSHIIGSILQPAFTRLAPIFLTLSLNSMLLATVTPSFVTLGAPKTLLNHHITPLRAYGYFDSISKLFNILKHRSPGLHAKLDVFGSIIPTPTHPTSNLLSAVPTNSSFGGKGGCKAVHDASN